MSSFYFLLHFLVITSFIFYVVPPTKGENANYATCSTLLYSCGKIQNVGYPFWGEDRPKFCGIENMKLSCVDNTTTSFKEFENSDFELSVQGINTSSHTMVFSLDKISKYCYLQNFNITKNISSILQVDVAHHMKNISLFYECDKCASKFRSQKNFTCSTYGNGTKGIAYYFGPSEVSKIGKGCSCLNNISFPVDEKVIDKLRSEHVSLSDVLSQQLVETRYKVNFTNECLSCEQSGGRCGSSYDSSSNQFICYCRDGPSSLICRTDLRVDLKKKTMITGLSISLGSATFVICGYGLFCVIRRWIQIKRKAKIFKRNGGFLLKQHVTTRDNSVDKIKIFNVDELDKATDSFNANRILGRGGQGTVYKGMLLDGKEVAIKKSLKVDESQIEHFINEVVILSQINHRNIVRLLGCCLETEVPLLVYEFIPNGTLGQHLHNPSKDFYITWKMRLQIALESAGALTYLHSASTTTIYHRDVKSSNILLDEKYKAKVADFGTSRIVMIDQTHLTTLVQGTLGYLDPEYFQTNQFTEKSDVYSFGVVLVELLTGQKPLTSTQSGGWKSLKMDFLLHMETSRLFDIIDSRILNEAKKEELLGMANLAKECLNLNGKQRPTMKEVANVLERITSSTMSSNVVYDIDIKKFNKTTEIGKMHEGDVDMSTFCSENVIGASSSTKVKPFVHYTV